MTGAIDAATPTVLPEQAEQQIRARVDSLSYLPTTAAVALKFVELGKNPEADPTDYAKVISADSSLSSKLLALANSSWAGVRSRVTTVQMAVNLLGLGTVRTLAISYCMTGLHNELRLSQEESRLFWEPSLCKAIAAKKLASLFNVKLADEAFVAGLFQDFAISVMYAVARQPYLDMLADPHTDVAKLREKERELFHLDHTEVGRMLAQKLELPEVFVDAVAFHHEYERLAELIPEQVVRDATYGASLLPHVLNVWNREDADALAAFLEEHAPNTDLPAYLAAVQEEYEQLYAFFHEGKVPEAKLAELLESTAHQVADNTAALVGTVNELMHHAATMSTQVSKLARNVEEEAAHDKLTSVLNREGFSSRAEEVLGKAGRYGMAIAMVYLDIDGFKKVNDAYGHELGDLALVTMGAKLKQGLPADAVIGRMGGDEFTILLYDCGEKAAEKVVKDLVSAISREPIGNDQQSITVSISAGLLYVRPSQEIQNLDLLVKTADKLMYQAKNAGGNRVQTRFIGRPGD